MTGLVHPGPWLAFVAGACGAHLSPVALAFEPRSLLALAGIATMALAGIRWTRTRIPAALVLGACWSLAFAAAAIADRLPLADHGRDLHVEGRVVGLPQQHPEAWRFDLAVTRWQADGADLSWRNPSPRLRVSWYERDKPVAAGSTFSGTIRMRVPWGFVNPGGFDAERHALVQGIDATGYVRHGTLQVPETTGVDGLRQRLAAWIRLEADREPVGALLAALAVGDQQSIDDDAWMRLRITGTTHLMAISGLHIGLVAAAAAWLAGFLHGRWPRAGLVIYRPELMAVAGLLGAIAYASLASFSLPVLRTVLMIAVVVAVVLARRPARPWQLLCWTAVVALLLDPLAPLSPGFWLSFLGVSALVLALPRSTVDTPWRGLLRAQWVASVFLLPVGIAWFDQASLVGPIANLVAIPVITFGIVPLLLLALATAGTAVGGLLVQLAAWVFDRLWAFLGWCETWPLASVDLPEPTITLVLLAVLGAALCLLPRPLPGPAFGLACLLPLFVPSRPPIPEGQAIVDVIDVGQGLSVLVRTREHALVFDSGARGRGGYDLGAVAVLPALRSRGVRHLDLLVTSHLDNDHAGGRDTMLRSFPDVRQRVGIDADPATRCTAGERWRWNGVSFRFLHPHRHFPDLGNDSSCVLLVTAGAHRLLLPGDIGAVIESRLLADRDVRNLDVLVVPHHGSRHSSGAAFVSATRPRFAIAPAGFGNRFGHPAPEVIARYQAAGSTWFDTGRDGLVSVRLGGDSPEPVRWRITERRYWRHSPK